MPDWKGVDEETLWHRPELTNSANKERGVKQYYASKKMHKLIYLDFQGARIVRRRPPTPGAVQVQIQPCLGAILLLQRVVNGFYLKPIGT